jgi:predicted DNA-binding transcriptional regulator AlpA
MTAPAKRLLSAEETAKYLGISVRTIYNQTGRKAKVKFPVRPKKIGKLLKFDKHEIDLWLDSI